MLYTSGPRHDPDAPGNHALALFCQLPGEDHPRHCTALCGEVGVNSWHCAAYFCTANTSSPRMWAAEPSKGGKYFFCVCTGLHHDVRPAGTVFSVAVSPVRPSLPLQHHCNATPGTAMTSPTLLRCTGTGRRHARHCASYGLPPTAPSSRPASGGRASNLYATTLEAAPVRAQDSPRRPNMSEIRRDSRQLRGTARHAFTRRRIVRHACKLPSPWPIKGEAVPQPQGRGTRRRTAHSHAFRLHPRYWHLPQSVPLGPGGLASSPASLVAPLCKHYGAMKYSAPSKSLLHVRPRLEPG
jgi:hypothetical protein